MSNRIYSCSTFLDHPQNNQNYFLKVNMIMPSRNIYTMLLSESYKVKHYFLPTFQSDIVPCSRFFSNITRIFIYASEFIILLLPWGFLQIFSPLSVKIFLSSHCFINSLKVSNIIPQKSLPGSSPQSHNSVKLCFTAH